MHQRRSPRRSAREPLPHGSPRINRNAAHGFSRHTVAYEAPGEGLEHDPYAVADLSLTKRIADKLERHYPAHPWMVTVTHAQGVAMIKIPHLMKRTEQWVLHINNLKSDPGLRSVIRAGGEILERHNVPRQSFSLDHFLAARDAGPWGRPKRRLVLPGEPDGPPPRLLVPQRRAQATPPLVIAR